MITTILLTIFYNFIWAILWPIRILPDVSLPADFLASFGVIGGYLSGLNEIVPVATILTILGLILTIEGSILLYKSIKWVYQKIPGVN